MVISCPCCSNCCSNQINDQVSVNQFIRNKLICTYIWCNNTLLISPHTSGSCEELSPPSASEPPQHDVIQAALLLPSSWNSNITSAGATGRVSIKATHTGWLPMPCSWGTEHALKHHPHQALQPYLLRGQLQGLTNDRSCKQVIYDDLMYWSTAVHR